MERAPPAALLEDPLIPREENSRFRTVTTAVTASIIFTAIAGLSLMAGMLRSELMAAVPEGEQFATLLVLGTGGAWWSNGTRALSTSGTFSWACDYDTASSNGLAFIEEDTATLVVWQPSGEQRRVTLSTLRRPVQCVQHGRLIYIACFGVEEQAGHSGLAVVDVETWNIVTERVIGIHVHHAYPAAHGQLFYTDVGDPWVDPPLLGGLYTLPISLSGDVTRFGPPLHARAALLPAELLPAGAVAAAAAAAASPRDGTASILPAFHPAAVQAHAAADGMVHIITQQPFGNATEIVSLASRRWGSERGDGKASSDVRVEARIRLPMPSVPSDGGADIFQLGGRLFCTDRYGGLGRLFELSRDGRLRVLASVELGSHPRYTDPLGSSTDIYSVSRDDGLLTVVDASTFAVKARQPAYAPLASFVVRGIRPTPVDAAALGVGSRHVDDS